MKQREGEQGFSLHIIEAGSKRVSWGRRNHTIISKAPPPGTTSSHTVLAHQVPPGFTTRDHQDLLPGKSITMDLSTSGIITLMTQLYQPWILINEPFRGHFISNYNKNSTKFAYSSIEIGLNLRGTPLKRYLHYPMLKSAFKWPWKYFNLTLKLYF